ncbi:hypothetical protein LB572_29600 [Mesorhizobium sp. BH1-1-5]|uniref:calcium-binding protein n=1 Tax=Mesorhizobium sp. BH1-1-5 TaxID=2876661 RepID=UPI001CCE17C5|nr:hypothetical protein [Mesorhizobium sp. BH1-1-5]MBZ9991252.1 hypothetical protein [Mesorhizobium sp. BH1-1-5]
MAIDDVLSHVDFSATNPSYVGLITTAIRNLYGDASNSTGSAEARKMFDILVNGNFTLSYVDALGTGNKAPPFGLTVFFDHGEWQRMKSVTSDGDVTQYSIEHLIAHETIHAILGLEDPKLANLTTPGVDYSGGAVPKENIMLSEMGDPNDRASYVNIVWSEKVGEIQGPVSGGLTDGEHVSLVVTDNQPISNINVSDRTVDTLLIGLAGNDKIIGGSANDYIYGGPDNDTVHGMAGDDSLYDGSGLDFLDGGAGDDSYYLSNDSERDIVTVGQGYDYIEGGDANDRIVLRADMLGLDPNVNTQGWSSPATGIQDGTKGVPLLGGFIYYTSPEATDAAFTPVGEKEYEHHIQPPEGPEVIEYEIGDFLTDRWTEFTSVNLNGDHPPTVWGSFNVHYQLQQTPWQTQAMYIEIDYWQGGQAQSAQVFIENFEEGDFGIVLANKSQADSSHYEGPGPVLFFGEEHAEYISNHGAYITIPTAAPPPVQEPQQRTAPVEEQFRQHPTDGPLSASLAPVAPFPENVACEDWAQVKASDHEGWAGSAFTQDLFEYIPHSANEWSDISALASISTGGLWYEPEPIGGLV